MEQARGTAVPGIELMNRKIKRPVYHHLFKKLLPFFYAIVAGNDAAGFPL
jgi:hypothetical protein